MLAEMKQPTIFFFKKNIMKKYTKIADQYILDETFTTSLPYSLGSALILASRFTNSSTFLSYCRCTNDKEYNNNINLYVTTSTITEKKLTLLKEKAKELGMIDVHLFAFKLKRKPSTIRGWYDILMNFAHSSILNHFYLLELLQFENVKYEIELSDIRNTLEIVLNTMGCENRNEVLTYFMTNWGKHFENMKEIIYRNRYDLNKIRGWFKNVKNNEGELFLVNYENIDYSDEEIDHQKFQIDIHVYGKKREQAWKSITDKICGDFCLYFPAEIKKILKKWYNNKEMESKTKKWFFEQWIGKWFDVESNWLKIQKYISKIEECSDESAFICGCKIGDWINEYMAPYMPTKEQMIHETEEYTSNNNEKSIKFEELSQFEQTTKENEPIIEVYSCKVGTQEWWDELNKPVDYKESPAISIRKQKKFFLGNI